MATGGRHSAPCRERRVPRRPARPAGSPSAHRQPGETSPPKSRLPRHSSSPLRRFSLSAVPCPTPQPALRQRRMHGSDSEAERSTHGQPGPPFLSERGGAAADPHPALSCPRSATGPSPRDQDPVRRGLKDTQRSLRLPLLPVLPQREPAGAVRSRVRRNPSGAGHRRQGATRPRMAAVRLDSLHRHPRALGCCRQRSPGRGDAHRRAPAAGGGGSTVPPPPT